MRTIAALAVLLAACAPAPETDPEPAVRAAEEPLMTPTDPSAGPSGLDAMTWMYSGPTENGSGRPRLIYSERSSDALGLNLQCVAPGSVEVLIVRMAPDVVPANWQFTLQSGEASTLLIGAATGEPASEMMVRASLPASDPVLAGLRTTGRISLTDDGRTHVFDAINNAELQTIGRFFNACA